MTTVEEIIGKSPKEISFYSELAEMIRYIDNLGQTLQPLDREPLFRRMAQHYSSLAQLDGIRGDMSKIAEYFEQQASEARGKNAVIVRVYPLTNHKEQK